MDNADTQLKRAIIAYAIIEFVVLAFAMYYKYFRH
jgi:hypothetical protein